jgi:LDH2 family malate/lactate/ureidoglycolate dehydrogenase
METKMRMDAAAFESWMQKVLVQRGYDEAESSETASWAAQTASYEVETHGARKIFSLMDAEFARSGSCVPQAQHEVLLKTPSLEVWDGAKKLGPAISSIAQAHAVEMADATGMGAVVVRDCNHFGWGPAYALTHLEDNEDLVVGNITQGAIPIVTPIGGTEPTLGSNAIALALSTGADDCPCVQGRDR